MIYAVIIENVLIIIVIIKFYKIFND